MAKRDRSYLNNVRITSASGETLEVLNPADLRNGCAVIIRANQLANKRLQDVFAVFVLPSGELKVKVPYGTPANCTGIVLDVPDEQKLLLRLMLDLGHICNDVTVE